MNLSLNLNNKKYICDLPYAERTELCKILDCNNKWKEMAGIYMNLSVQDISLLKKFPSPTDELLTNWGQRNHTIFELFAILSKMEHYQAMLVLKPFIAKKYHCFINEGERSITRLLGAGVALAGAREFSDNDNINNLNQPQINILGCEKNMVAMEIPNVKNDNHIISPSRAETALAESCLFSESTDANFQIPYDELLSATNDWNDNNILGKGGFGIVFKGNWKNTIIAIKRLAVKNEEYCSTCMISCEVPLGQSYKELKILSSLRQDNILPLYGCSVDGEYPCLVYQLMPNGSLEDRLQRKDDTPPLSWDRRYKISLGIARGLQFLHTRYHQPLIHGDIKSANILLDTDWTPRIGDFGLVKEGPVGNCTHRDVTTIFGTVAYLPTDYLRSKQLSVKVDTYSFGVVLFEIATGRKATDKKKKSLVNVIHESVYVLQYLDNNAPFQGYEGKLIFDLLVETGKKCTELKAKDRPEMNEVYQQLDGLQTNLLEVYMKTKLSEQSSIPITTGEFEAQKASFQFSSNSLYTSNSELQDEQSPPPIPQRSHSPSCPELTAEESLNIPDLSILGISHENEESIKEQEDLISF